MEKTKEEKRGQFQRLEGEIAEESKRLAIAIGGAAIYSAGVNLFIVPAGLWVLPRLYERFWSVICICRFRILISRV